MELQNKMVVISGANRGMGYDFALEAARRGAQLVLPLRSKTNNLEDQLLEAGAESVELFTVDLSEPKEVQAFIATLQDRPIDFLINNAGLLTGGLLEEQSFEDIHRMLQVNVAALIQLTRAVLPGMLQRKSGKIVNNASVSGIMNLPCASTYSASKAAVVAFTRCLEAELQGTGVSTLLLLTPGVKTDMYDQIYESYGSHMDLSFLSHVSSKQWAQKVFQAIERGERECRPTSFSNKIGLRLAQHAPKFFSALMRKGFQR